MTEELNPEAWRAYKDRGGERKILSPKEQQGRLKVYIELIKDALEEADTESREEFGSPHEIRGVLILGSWADGAATNDSDLDIVTLSSGAPYDFPKDILTRIRQKFREINIFTQVDHLYDLNIDLSNADAVQQLLDGSYPDIADKNLILVTPHKEVAAQLETLNPR